MRVYEFARQKGMKSKEVVETCLEIGIEIKAQSKLNIDQIEKLNQHLNGNQNVSNEVKPELKQENKIETSNISKDIGYVVCECEPFTDLGELGKKPMEFIKQVQEQGNKPVIFLPKYSFIDVDLVHIVDVSFNMGQEKLQASLYKLIKDGVTYFFVGDDKYFNREDIYGYEDDIKRFTFFNRAILESLPLLKRPIYDFYLNDWQTSIFSLLLKVEYKSLPYYSQIKTTLNIHDLSHQGWCQVEQLFNGLGIEERHYNNGLMRMGNSVNLLKSGIETADMIALTKVSEMQMKCAKMVESGISAVLQRNLREKLG